METLKFELKAASDDGAGSFEGVMSTPALDRDNEIVDSKAFEPLPEHITIDIDHGLTVEKTVGSGKPYYDTDGLLKVKGTFASTPLGQQVRTLVKEGHIRHMSVAFHNPVREIDGVDGKQHVRKASLVNCTITGIPANTATELVAKVGARNSQSDMKRIQAAHDAMVEMGAACPTKHVHDADTKSVDTEPPADAATAASAGAQVDMARARTRAKLLLGQANLALE